MSRTFISGFFLTAILPLALISMSTGCTTQRPAQDRQSTKVSSGIIAVIDGQAITRDSIWEPLAESSGRAALENLILDRELERRAAEKGIQITPDRIQEQRNALISAWSEIGNQIPADRVLDSIRIARNLGPSRFEKLLRRNALLESLTSPPSGSWEPSEVDLDRAIERRFGKRFRIRIFVSQDPQDAARLRDQTKNARAESRAWVFSDACASRSIHPTRDRGGLIASMSPLDTAYPSVISETLLKTDVGHCSPVLSTEAGYVLLYIESVIEPIIPTLQDREHTRASLIRDARRLAMQRLREEILGSSEVTVLDKSLNWSWSNRP